MEAILSAFSRKNAESSITSEKTDALLSSDYRDEYQFFLNR